MTEREKEDEEKLNEGEEMWRKKQVDMECEKWCGSWGSLLLGAVDWNGWEVSEEPCTSSWSRRKNRLHTTTTHTTPPCFINFPVLDMYVEYSILQTLSHLKLIHCTTGALPMLQLVCPKLHRLGRRDGRIAIGSLLFIPPCLPLTPNSPANHSVFNFVSVYLSQ